MNQPLLQIKNLSLQFSTENGLVDALNNVSLEVKRGEVVAIVGESGSGKSVTSLSVLKLLPSPPAIFSSGEIFFSTDGQQTVDLLKLPVSKMRAIRGNQIAMIFQEPMTSLNPVFTCGDQVMETIRLHEKVSTASAKQKTIELFAQVKLPNPVSMFSRYPHQLSGGQKQRVMIAMAMSCNPALLIADEPTTALDVTVQRAILLLIKELQQQHHMGVIFITHDLGVVAEIADRVIVMYKGNIVEQGTVNDILRHAKHSYTRGLLACRPELHPKGERLPVAADFLENNDSGEMVIRVVKRESTLAAASGPDKKLPILKKQSTPMIRVENLKVWFPGRKNLLGKPLDFIKAVDDVSFTVYKGETLGLVGESGCGKTTLGRTLLRLIEPTGGRILLNDKNLLDYAPKALRSIRKNMQIIFQDPYSSLNPAISIGRAIQEPLKVHGFLRSDSARKDLVIALLEKVNLKAEHYSRYPHEFSGGQRQRIVIARALALNPSFIICDESVSSLDVSVQAQVLNLLSDLKKEFGFTVIFISHDLSVVYYISDRIMVMNRGKIEETGEAEQVYHHPRSNYTQSLIQAVPKIAMSDEI